MRACVLFVCVALAVAGAPKGKAADASAAPTVSPPTAPPVPSGKTATSQITNQTMTVSQSGNQSFVLLDLKAVATNLFKLIENEKYDEASRLFANGMSYITNGRVYDLDLSMPSAIKSIPKRTRTQLVWTYIDGDDYEIWGHCLVRYPNNAQLDPEFLRIHFNKNGLIDMFTHIQPKAAQCTAVEKVTKLALLRPDGSVVDAPQDQLARMMAEQEAAKQLVNRTIVNSTTTRTTTSTNTSSGR